MDMEGPVRVPVGRQDAQGGGGGAGEADGGAQPGEYLCMR